MERFSKLGGRQQRRGKNKKEANHFAAASLSKKDLLSLLRLHGVIVKPVSSFETSGQSWQVNFI